jgi:hypothetical protein
VTLNSPERMARRMSMSMRDIWEPSAHLWDLHPGCTLWFSWNDRFSWRYCNFIVDVCNFIATPESPAYGLALFNFPRNRFGPSFPHSNEWVLNMKTLSKSGGKRFRRKLNRAYTAKQAILNHRLAILVSRWNWWVCFVQINCLSHLIIKVVWNWS